ncbi:hypothetical protein ACFLYH_00295 [Candidatus Dependentiae bacterium]
MITLIPMAGLGNRFLKKNYPVSKPFIPIMNDPMVITALRSFPQSDRYIFVCLKEHYDTLKAATKALSVPVEIIVIDKVTQGQACTCLHAKETFNKDDSLFIASCDYQVVYDKKRYNKLMNDNSIDVIIWTFKIGAIKKANPKAFAYCKIDNGFVTQLVEKQTISNDPNKDSAVVGSFTYKKASLFEQSAQQMIKKNIKVNGEFCVGTSINQLIEQGYRVVPFEVEQFISFGDPFELELFNYWQNYFNRL